MALFPLKFPPGFSRPGTKYDAKGRWYDGTLVRWFEGVMQPVGGWDKLETSGTPLNLTGVPRGALAWVDNSDIPNLALGTETLLYIYKSGVLTDITPAGFTSGGADAVQTSGVYGGGIYGDGPYGTGGDAPSVLVEANTWQMDNHGEDLLAVSFGDGKIYVWDTSVGIGTVAAALTNAPTSCRGVVVTPEQFVVALGPGGLRRRVQWADVDDRTDWTAAPDNQAGDLDLPGTGEILAGRRARGETLIWTTTDLFAMRYIAGQFVYTIPLVGSACGAVSRRSMQVVDGVAFWMGQKGFFEYNGFVKPLPSTVGDFVFNDMNRLQRSKIWCELRSAFGEVTWYYPSASSNECDKYVTYNWRENIWYFGLLERTAGFDKGAFNYSVATDAGGAVYQQETGDAYLNPAGTTLVPFAESGPIEIGKGDQTMLIQEYIPDELTLGDLDVTIFTSLYPTGTETESSTFTAANPTSVRLLGRQVRVKVKQKNTGWRLGTMRLNVVPSGGR